MGILSLTSNLAINGTPDRYDPAGKLGSLPPEASNLNFDGAIPAGADNFLNTNANGFTVQAPVGVTQFIDDGQTSQYGLSATPDRYDTAGKLGSLPPNASQLDFDGALPPAVDNFVNTNANGFTIQAPVGVTQFTDPGNTSVFGFPGAIPPPTDFFLNTNANGFTIQTPVGVTQFIDPGNTSIYGFPGAIPPPTDFFLNTHANGFTIQTPVGVTQFIDPGNTSIYGFAGAVPPPTDFFLNTHANGFTIQAPIGVTQFVDPGNTSIYGFSGATPPGVDYFTNNHANGFTIQNPVGISQFTNGGQTSIYGFPGTLPAPTDFFLNTNAKGFTIRNPIGQTQFVGVGGSGTSYINPSGLNALRNVNYFSDAFSGAEGFKDRPAVMQTYYLGINDDQTKYQYPQTVQAARLMNVRLGQGAGTAKLENQLGNGSKMGNTGFYAENRYAEAVRNDSNQSLLASWALRRRSPSPLEQQYSKFKLRDEAFNPTFIGHPLILRGLQNPDVLGPQRWGIDALGQQEGRTAANNLGAALDGGFIRGGASTALERSIVDTARIAKFMASPKGLVWITTQFGLGKSNVRPFGHVSDADLIKLTGNAIPINNTYTHLGLTSLLSVPTTAFGIHISRHGVPYVKGIVDDNTSYGYIQKALIRDELTNGASLNRNWMLKTDYASTELPWALSLGSPIPKLSTDQGGPQSVYGIGSTTIRRYVDTLEGWKRYRPRAYPDPIATKELPEQPIVNIEDQNRSYKRYLRKKRAIIRANDKISAENAARNKEVDDLNASVAALDLELSPWFSYTKRYAPWLNQNKTAQGSIAEDKENSKELSANYNDLNNPEEPIGLDLVLKVAVEGPNTWTPGDGRLGKTAPSPHAHEPTPFEVTKPLRFNTLPYENLRALAKSRNDFKTTAINDFRKGLNSTVNQADAGETFSTDPKAANFAEANLRDYYGFGDHGNPSKARSNPYKKGGKDSGAGNIDDTVAKLKTDPKGLATDADFRGDRVNAIDYISNTKTEDIYPDGAQDFIKFYFSGIKLFDAQESEVIVFRATLKGLADSFQPGWSNIQVMGRPDGPALYSSFERNISFGFTVAATSREELVPMWRKLNYLGSYTMPIYGAGRPGGALCRLTIGDMFNNVPGYFTGLTVAVNDEATWDLADDRAISNNKLTKVNKASKQLPNLVDVDVQFKILHDWRPQKGGRVYYLYEGNYTDKAAISTSESSWLWDSSI